MRFHRPLVVLVILMIIVGIVPRAARASSDFSYNITTAYTVSTGGSTHVKTTYVVTNNTARQFLSGLQIQTAVTDLTNLKTAYTDGTLIAATESEQTATSLNYVYDYANIALTFPRQNYGLGKTWSFSIEYDTTKLIELKGASYSMFIPALTLGPDDQYQAIVSVPLTFGAPHFAGATSSSGGISGDSQILVFDKDALTKQALAITFGDATIYDLNFNFPLENTTALPQTLSVTLPPDTNNQTVYINKLDPAPQDTRLDEDGNILADYRLSSHQKITVKTDVAVAVHYNEYDLSAAQPKSAIPADLVDHYTQSAEFWNTLDPKIVAAAAGVVKPGASVVDNVRALNQFVIDTLSYNPEKIKYNIRQGASKALANPTNAVCLEYSDLLITLLRSQGIPARTPIGYAYSSNLKASTSVPDSLHSWVEAYIPGIGWMTLDPTWGEKFNNFGKSDLDHVAFAVWGRSDASPAPTMHGTTDLGYQYENTTLQFATQPPKVTISGQVSGTQFVLLPFVSIDRFDAVAQPMRSSDLNQITVFGQTIALGSLAPLQKVDLWQPTIGHNWLSQANITLSFGQGQGTQLASANLKVNWWPMITLIGLILAAIILAGIMKWRRRHHAAVADPTS